MFHPVLALGRLAAVGSVLVCAVAAAQVAEPVVVAKGLVFPEGPVFVGGQLYLVDYGRSNLLRIDGDAATVVWHDSACGANGLIEAREGLLVACFDGDEVAIVSAAGQRIGRIDRDGDGARLQSPNDFATDAKGGLYFTTSGHGAATGRVHYRAANGVVTMQAGGLDFANGVAVSPDGATLYVGESRTDRIHAYGIGADGRLGPGRVFVNVAEAMGLHAKVAPDGIRVDAGGNLFVALYDGPGIAILDRTGKLIGRIDVPGQHHTNLAISADGKSIYATGIDAASDSGAAGGALYRFANPLER